MRTINLSAGDMTEGPHTVWAGVLHPPLKYDERDFEVPCAPTPTPTATPVPPDLVITGFTINPPGPTISATQGVTFTVDIENQGESDVNSLFWVAIHIDPTPSPPNGGGLPVLWQGVSAIVAGGRGPLTFSDYHFTEDGAHTVYAYVDNWDHIAEGEENNNASSAINVTVSGAPIPTSTPTSVPDPGTIDGFTRIWPGSGVPDIQGQIPVYLYQGSDPEPIMTTISNDNGYYRFDNVPAGTNYRVYAETMVDSVIYCGSTDPIPVEVRLGETTRANLVLGPWC
jgi:hypothetical protein